MFNNINRIVSPEQAARLHEQGYIVVFNNGKFEIDKGNDFSRFFRIISRFVGLTNDMKRFLEISKRSFDDSTNALDSLDERELNAEQIEQELKSTDIQELAPKLTAFADLDIKEHPRLAQIIINTSLVVAQNMQIPEEQKVKLHNMATLLGYRLELANEMAKKPIDFNEQTKQQLKIAQLQMRILLLELEKKLEIAALEKGDKKLIGELEIKLQIAKKLRNISDDPATLLESFKRALPSLHYTALLKDQVEPTLLSFRNESGALDKEKIFRQFERDLRGLATLTIKGIPPNANLTKLIKHHYNETAHDQLIASYREDFFAYLTDYFAKQAKSDFTTKIEQKALKIMGLMQQGSLGEIHHEIAKAALPLTYGQEVNDFFAMPKKEFELHMPHSETALKPFKHSFLLPQRPLTAKSPEDSKAYSAEYDLIENTITYNKEMQVMLEGEPIPSFPRIRCVALLDIENENLNITIGSKNQESLMHYLLTGKWLFS